MFDEVLCSQPVHCFWCHRQVMLTWQESNRNSKITKKSFKSKIKINKMGLDNEKPSWILSYNNMLWLVVYLSLIPFSYFATHSSKRPHFVFFRLIVTADLSMRSVEKQVAVCLVERRLNVLCNLWSLHFTYSHFDSSLLKQKYLPCYSLILTLWIRWLFLSKLLKD